MLVALVLLDEGIVNKIVSLVVLALLAGPALAGESSESSAVAVPELDGGMAFLALALTAGIIALIRERKRA